MDQTASDRHADEFFARHTNPTSETIARLKQEAHPDGDIEAVVAEIREFDFWRRFAAAIQPPDGTIVSCIDGQEPVGLKKSSAVGRRWPGVYRQRFVESDEPLQFGQDVRAMTKGVGH